MVVGFIKEIDEATGLSRSVLVLQQICCVPSMVFVLRVHCTLFSHKVYAMDVQTNMDRGVKLQ